MAKSNLKSKAATEMLAKAKDAPPQDAVSLLKADHQDVTELYEKFEKAKTAAQKKDLAGQIALALSVHMRIEEDIFYPAMQKALKDDRDLVAEAKVEHATLKNLITQVEAAGESEEFDAKVQVMREYTKHHVKEEETEMFPKAQASSADLEALGKKLATRKLDLLETVAGKSSRGSAPPKPSSLFKQRSARGNGRSDDARA